MSKRNKVLLVLLGFVFNAMSALAQVPCSGDPDDDGYDPNGCPTPLDTWIYVIVILALVYGYYHLKKQNKSLLTQ